MLKPVSEELPCSKVTPDPKLEKRKHRDLTAEYKMKIIAQANTCAYGELGPLLCKEGLCNRQLKQWRKKFENVGVAGLSKSVPGPKSMISAAQCQFPPCWSHLFSG